MRRVTLRDDGTPGRERRRRVAAGHAEREREVARTEDGDRPDRDEHPSQVGDAVRGVGDDGFEMSSGLREVGERAELSGRAGELAHQPRLPSALSESAIPMRSSPSDSSPSAIACRSPAMTADPVLASTGAAPAAAARRARSRPASLRGSRSRPAPGAGVDHVNVADPEALSAPAMRLAPVVVIASVSPFVAAGRTERRTSGPSV